MSMVEIRLAPTDVAARLGEIRRWLSVHGIEGVKFTSTGSSNETVVLIEFYRSGDAEEFAQAFSGILVST